MACCPPGRSRRLERAGRRGCRMSRGEGARPRLAGAGQLAAWLCAQLGLMGRRGWERRGQWKDQREPRDRPTRTKLPQKSMRREEHCRQSRGWRRGQSRSSSPPAMLLSQTMPRDLYSSSSVVGARAGRGAGPPSSRGPGPRQYSPCRQAGPLLWLMGPGRGKQSRSRPAQAPCPPCRLFPLASFPT